MALFCWLGLIGVMSGCGKVAVVVCCWVFEKWVVVFWGKGCGWKTKKLHCVQFLRLFCELLWG